MRASKIKMRTNKDGSGQCSNCLAWQEDSLQMFDIQIGQMVFTLCDKCNEDLLAKSVRAANMVNEKVKTKADLLVIRKRRKEVGMGD